MTVIAKKIAFADKSGPVRPDAETVAAGVLVDIRAALAKWLSVEDISKCETTISWAPLDVNKLPAIIMTAKGPTKDSRIVVAFSEDLSALSSYRLLGIENGDNAASQAALKPFIQQNLRDFGLSLSQTSSFDAYGKANSLWVFEKADGLDDQVGETDMLRIEIDCAEGNQDDHRAIFYLSSDLLCFAGSANSDDDALGAANDRRLSPRIGPCHIEVRAVADRVRMSVADCSRLEIGQVVSLPGLRFDKLDLTIDMHEGPYSLADAALGADKGQKAVRLNRGLDPSFRVPPQDDHAMDRSETASK